MTDDELVTIAARAVCEEVYGDPDVANEFEASESLYMAKRVLAAIQPVWEQRIKEARAGALREHGKWMREQVDAEEKRIRADEREKVTQLLADLVDPDDCWFDHNGGCQVHGYISLQPGELCPHEEAKRLLREDDE
jgi:hypothetical protein